MGFGTVEGRKSLSPIDLARGLYNSLYYRTSRYRKLVWYSRYVCLFAETMFVVLIILSVLCAILSILTLAVCCYICARRYYIQVCCSFLL